MANGKPNLFEFLKRFYATPISLGMKPILVLDSSAVIDLDQSYQKKYGLRRSFLFLDHLQNAAPGLQILVPQLIKTELEYHREWQVGGRPEISSDTLDKIQRLPSYDEPAELFFSQEQARLDQARYCLRLMYAATAEGKKAVQDPISKEDWKIIDTAISVGIFAEEMLLRNKLTGQKNILWGTYKTAALTADAHIYGTITRVFEEPEGVELTQFIKPVNVRSYTINEVN